MTKHLDTLLQKEMSRKEFLATLGFGIASILGFSTLIKVFTGKSVESRLGQHVGKAGNGFGSGPYGR